MYVGCLFWKDEPVNDYCGRTYVYHTDLPLKIGDKVMLPVRNESPKRGMVAQTDMPTPPFECREVTEYYREGEADGNAR